MKRHIKVFTLQDGFHFSLALLQCQNSPSKIMYIHTLKEDYLITYENIDLFNNRQYP